MVRLQGRQSSPMAREPEGEVLRVFKQEVKEQKAIIIKALSEVSAFGETFCKRVGLVESQTNETLTGVYEEAVELPRGIVILGSGDR